MANKYIYVTPDSGGSGGSGTAPYTETFNNTTDWSGPSSGYYFITINQSTHEKSATPSVHVYETDGSNFRELLTGVSLDSSGNVTIRVSSSPDNRFNGKVSIS